MNRRGSTTKRHSKDGVRPLLISSKNQEEFSNIKTNHNEMKKVLPNSENRIEPKLNSGLESLPIKPPEDASITTKLTPDIQTSTLSLEVNQPRKLSLSHSESSLATLGRPVSTSNLNWFKPVITGSLEFSKTSLCLPNHMKDGQMKSNKQNSINGKKANLTSNSLDGKVLEKSKTYYHSGIKKISYL